MEVYRVSDVLRMVLLVVGGEEKRKRESEGKERIDVHNCPHDLIEAELWNDRPPKKNKK